MNSLDKTVRDLILRADSGILRVNRMSFAI